MLKVFLRSNNVLFRNFSKRPRYIPPKLTDGDRPGHEPDIDYNMTNAWTVFNPILRLDMDSVLKLHTRKDWTLKGVKKRRADTLEEKAIKDQIFLPARYQYLGPDLATSHFIVYRGGKVRAVGETSWYMLDQNGKSKLSRFPDKSFRLEAVDASGTQLMYEGFGNFIHLEHLKELYLRNCDRIDDWCLDRLTMFRSTLKVLDLSGCKNITERGLASLCRMKELRLLILNDLPQVKNIELLVILLEDAVPLLQVDGVDITKGKRSVDS